MERVDSFLHSRVGFVLGATCNNSRVAAFLVEKRW